jgi:hypothetical protein
MGEDLVALTLGSVQIALTEPSTSHGGTWRAAQLTVKHQRTPTTLGVPRRLPARHIRPHPSQKGWSKPFTRRGAMPGTKKPDFIHGVGG